MPSNTVQIKWKGSTDISNSVHWDSLQITLVLTKEVSKVQFYIHQTSSDPVLALGDQIDIYQNGSHVFGGTVTEKETTIAGGAGILPEVLITATDWSFKMDTKLVAKTYAQMDPHDIIADIVARYTDGTYTINNVQKGNFLIPSVKFNYEPVTKAIQKVASLIGWDWYVDPNKDVHFFLSQNIPAPFNIDDTSGNIEWPSVDVDTDLTNMKNSVYVIGGLYKKLLTVSTTPDVYQTDGVKTVFPLAFTYDNDSSFTITLNGVAQTYGIENQVTDPSTVQFLYNPTNRYVRSTSVQAGGKTIKVYGNAKIPILAHASDAAAVATYGEIQDSIIDKQITSVPEAQARAKAEVLMYGHAVYTVKFNTIQPGLAVGQTIILNSAKLGFTNLSLTIKRITGTGYSPTQIKWQVEAYGSDQVTFVDIMSTILQKENQDNPVDDSTIVQTLVTLAEILNMTDAVSVANTQNGPYCWG
jgi:hypothetical protein